MIIVVYVLELRLLLITCGQVVFQEQLNVTVSVKIFCFSFSFSFSFNFNFIYQRYNYVLGLVHYVITY